jgi:hypothetical protein
MKSCVSSRLRRTESLSTESEVPPRAPKESSRSTRSSLPRDSVGCKVPDFTGKGTATLDFLLPIKHGCTGSVANRPNRQAAMALRFEKVLDSMMRAGQRAGADPPALHGRTEIPILPRPARCRRMPRRLTASSGRRGAADKPMSSIVSSARPPSWKGWTACTGSCLARSFPAPAGFCRSNDSEAIGRSSRPRRLSAGRRSS